MNSALRSHLAFRLRSARAGLRVCNAAGWQDIGAMYRAEMSTIRGILKVMKRAAKEAA